MSKQTTIAKVGPSVLARPMGFGPLSNFRQEMDEWMRNFFGEQPFPALNGDTLPRLDLSETEDAIEIETDLPGYKPDEITIDVGDGYLTISGQHSEEQKEEDKNRTYHRVERISGNFSRSVWLPCPVQEDQIDAELKEGVLTIHLPKAEEAKKKRVQVHG